jgi:hypothetical protein
VGAGISRTTGPALTRFIATISLAQSAGDATNSLMAPGLFEMKGLVQRILLVTFMAWVFAVASRLHKSWSNRDSVR